MQQNMTKEAFAREYEAQFTEAQTSYFPQQLIRQTVELAQQQGIEPITNLEQPAPTGNYYAGLDLGKLQDHSALAIVNIEDNSIKLLYIHQFPLNTSYTNVIGHLARANQTFHINKTLIDQTGIGEPILEETQNQNLTNTQGIKFTQQTKQTLLTNLKLLMEQNRLAIPYNPQLCEQINNQQYNYTKNGQLQFTCPPNTHDDMLWALALAAYATRTEPTPKLWTVTQ